MNALTRVPTISVHKIHRRSSIKGKQRGVSFVEVLVAMVILAIGALAIVNLQTASTIAISHSSDHFKINELGQLIVEQLKADAQRAGEGEYNTDYTDYEATDTATLEVAQRINEWKATMTRSIPLGETSVSCTESECNIGLKWYELSHNGITDQVYNLKSPI